MPERYGYTSFDGEPVDRRGGPEHQSGRVNHSRMDKYADRNSLSFENFKKHRHGELYSTVSNDLEDIPAREHPHRSDPSQTYERSVRGYSPAWHGSVVSSGSSPQNYDNSYASEPTHLPRGTPMGDSYREYKSLAEEADGVKERYHEQADDFQRESTSEHYIPRPQRRFKGRDDFHYREEKTAFRTGDSYHLASKSRDEHNFRYMGHFKDRADFDRHEKAAVVDEIKSEGWHARENEHRRRRPRDPPRRSDFDKEMQSMIDDAWPEESEYQELRPGERRYDREGNLIWH